MQTSSHIHPGLRFVAAVDAALAITIVYTVYNPIFSFFIERETALYPPKKAICRHCRQTTKNRLQIAIQKISIEKNASVFSICRRCRRCRHKTITWFFRFSNNIYYTNGRKDQNLVYSVYSVYKFHFRCLFSLRESEILSFVGAFFDFVYSVYKFLISSMKMAIFPMSVSEEMSDVYSVYKKKNVIKIGVKNILLLV